MKTEPVHSRDIGYNIRYIVSLQRAYKLSKPTKFAGGKWSPRAAELYRGLDVADRKIADEELALLSEDEPVDRWGNSIEVKEELE